MISSTFLYPKTRFRRTRTSRNLRNLVSEYAFCPEQLILPIFLTVESTNSTIESLPDVQRWSLNALPVLLEKLMTLGVTTVALFPQVPSDKKYDDCREAFNHQNLVCRALKIIKAQAPELITICDVALDPYNPHGHDGYISDNGHILNDETIGALIKQSLVLSDAGADIIAPSDMMDGRIGEIRKALDANGFCEQPILSYAAKYASAFYGPFRQAIGSFSALKSDKSTYQMDPRNSEEALREVAADINEGADIVMIKPGMAYLDIIHRVKSTFGLPTFAYHVSGEYASLKAASANGWLDWDKCIWETMLAFRRSGCDAVLTYAALDLAKLWREQYL